MNDGHFHHWQAIIKQHMERTDLHNLNVLDYGCNQGGFLRTLYDAYPFHSAVGVDIAEASLEVARQKSSHIPADFETLTEFEDRNYSNKFDLAFSHEVIYLLPDLEAHASLILNSLKPSGVYYAVTGCHTNNPLWNMWGKAIRNYSNIFVPDYSLDDYVHAFEKAGFSVSLRPIGIHDFIKLEEDDKVYFPTMMDKISYYQNHKIVFKFTLPAENK